MKSQTLSAITASLDARAKHTPGPWNMKEVRANKNDLVYCKISNERLIGFAGVYIDGKKKVSDQETQANAHLIAAAPELLEAIKAILPIFEAFTIDELSVTTIDEAIALLPSVKAAISKAEGK